MTVLPEHMKDVGTIGTMLCVGMTMCIVYLLEMCVVLGFEAEPVLCVVRFRGGTSVRWGCCSEFDIFGD